MDLVFLFLYMIVFILQIVLLVLSIKKRRKIFWLSLFSLELISTIGAAFIAKYYDGLPGYGFMPGLSYIGEVIFSLGAAVTYGIMLLISICTLVVISIKNNSKS